MTGEQSAKTITVRVAVSVTVNKDDWCTTFGTEPGEVRADVRRYVTTVVQSMAVLEEVDGAVRAA